MQSQCEPSHQWYAAGVQEDLTRIDAKNCLQIINLGHPHVTMKVMHMKTTRLFELGKCNQTVYILFVNYHYFIIWLNEQSKLYSILYN